MTVSPTLEERLAELLGEHKWAWLAWTDHPEATSDTNNGRRKQAFRNLAVLILAAAKQHGLVIGEGELDAAWKEAIEAMPERWVGPWLAPGVDDGGWMADATSRRRWSNGGDNYENELAQEEGPTPVAALHALAERLRR